MKFSVGAFSRLWLAMVLALSVIGVQPAQAKIYVNATLGDLKPENKVKVTAPKPVQLIFEFQRDGIANARATKLVRPMMIEAMKAQGVFADFVDTPVADGALLSVKFNNIPEKNAAGKGFASGLTLGLAGLFVTDFYEVRFDLVPTTGSEPIVTEVKHQLHLKKGKKDIPDPGIEVKNIDVGIRTIIAQVAAHGLNQLAADPRFPK